MKNVIIFQIFLLCIQGLLYLGVQTIEGPAHDVSSRFDKKIPFWTPSVLIYVLWFPLIFAFPLMLFSAGGDTYDLYIFAIIADIFISSIIYLAYPSSFRRPVPPDNFTGRLVAILYKCNYTGKNCMPSMHCSMCFIIMYCAALCMTINPALYAGVFILAFMIVISTVLTKQHVLIDVITGLAAAMLSIGIATVM